jgi:hypothetical protein
MTRTLRLLTCVTAAILSCASLGAQRDAAQSSAAAGATLGGVVTTDDGRTPVRRALVVVTAAGAPRAGRYTATDDRGAFQMDALPPGHYIVAVSKPPFVPAYYGAKVVGSTQGTPIALAGGEKRTDLSIALTRGGAITGLVLDGAGQPIANTTVRAQRVSGETGGPRAVVGVVGPLVGTATTDERGQYRAFGLVPGDYVVSALPRQTFGATNEIHAVTDVELQWATRALSGGGAGGPEAGTPPQVGPAVAFSTVFYPDAVDVANAQVVTVAAGQERSGVDMHMRLIATSRVTGHIVEPSGQPASGATVTLLPASTSGDAGMLAAQQMVGLLGTTGLARSAADGAFTLNGVEPGHYIAIARTAAGRGQAAGPPLSAMQTIDVNGQDVAGLVLTLAPGKSVSGHFVFDAQRLTRPQDPAKVSLQLVVSGTVGSSVIASLPIASDGAFTLSGVMPGRYRVVASLPSWSLRSAVLGGKDIADAPFELGADDAPSDLVVTFTDRPAQIHGVLLDGAGKPASDLSVVLFSVDRDTWYQNSRRLRAPVRPASDGSFAFTDLPPGEYCLAALTEFQPNEWFTPAFLAQVAPAAVHVTVAEGESKTQDLRLKR